MDDDARRPVGPQTPQRLLLGPQLPLLLPGSCFRLAIAARPGEFGLTYSALKAGSKGAFYLPGKRNVNAKFISQFLAGRKQLLKLSEVRWVNRICGFRELSVKSLYELTTYKDELAHYLPDVTSLSKLDRAYFLNAL